MTWRMKRVSAAVPIALVLVLVLTSQVLATSWSTRVRLTSSGDINAGSHSLVTLGSSNAAAIYQQGPNFWVRRTTDSGATWKSPLRLTNNTTGPWFAAISGLGTNVDAVWSEDDSAAGAVNVRYRRSTDSGATFAASVPLATLSKFDLATPDVSRGPNGVVAVSWHEQLNNLIRVRVSTDGGATFAPAQTLATISADYSRPTSVAVGDGAIYVAYFTDDTHVALRRSVNNGSTWKPAVPVAGNGSLEHNIQAVSL